MIEQPPFKDPQIDLRLWKLNFSTWLSLVFAFQQAAVQKIDVFA